MISNIAEASLGRDDTQGGREFKMQIRVPPRASSSGQLSRWRSTLPYFGSNQLTSSPMQSSFAM